jgi:CMP-N-acetylneuraminic acid synthetase
VKTYAFIFARGGSKGVARKNIRSLAGKPLLVYSIELAKKIELIDKVFVSTEDPEIANVALDNGVNVIDRPGELALDDTPEWLVWQHAIEWIQERGDDFDVFLSLPATSPLRNSDDVLHCLCRLDAKTDVVVTITESSRSPWFNMVKISKEGAVSLLLSGGNYTQRQTTPKTYDITTVAYVSRPQFILNNNGLWGKRVGGVKIPIERALDIDTEFDLEIAEFLMKRQLTATGVI